MNIVDLKEPLVKNSASGYISVPYESLANENVSGFHYTGIINDTYINVTMPRDMVRDAVIYRPKYPTSYHEVKHNKEYIAFMLLSKTKIIEYIKTGKMEVTQSLYTNKRKKQISIREPSLSTDYNPEEIAYYYKQYAVPMLKGEVDYQYGYFEAFIDRIIRLYDNLQLNKKDGTLPLF